MSDLDRIPRRVRHGRIRASLASATCLLRGLPLFFGAAPKTPLRVLCIVALDTLHVLRNCQPLPRKRIHELATLLDFQACTNAAWDHKDFCEAEYQSIRQRLEKAGLGSWIEEYLSQLRELERRRPSIGGDHRRFDEVRRYREAVVRLSLATVAAIALNAEHLEDEIRATHSDGDVETLFRIAIQCQIIDDVLDYADDAAAGLPSFLTASASLAQAMELTAKAARAYAASPERSTGNGVFPFRLALSVVTAVTKLVIRVGHCRTWGTHRFEDSSDRLAGAERCDAHAIRPKEEGSHGEVGDSHEHAHRHLA